MDEATFFADTEAGVGLVIRRLFPAPSLRLLRTLDRLVAWGGPDAERHHWTLPRFGEMTDADVDQWVGRARPKQMIVLWRGLRALPEYLREEKYVERNLRAWMLRASKHSQFATVCLAGWEAYDHAWHTLRQGPPDTPLGIPPRPPGPWPRLADTPDEPPPQALP
jgi:hypothetical protein